MAIQEEQLQPQDPLATLADDYEHAVLHLAWNRNSKSTPVRDKRTLLFAWVELLPKEVPPPIDDGEHGMRIKGGAHYVYVRHLVVSADRAIRWYLSSKTSSVVVPDTDGEFPGDDAPNAKRACVQELSEEPVWPNLLLAVRGIPFSHDWHSRPRVHHLIPSVRFETKALWKKDVEKDAATELLRGHLHFDLDNFPEYWGSLHLIAPNPVFRTLVTHPEMDANGHIRSVLARFECRRGHSVNGLELLLVEERETGLSIFRTIDVQSAIIRVSFGHDAYKTGETVYDRRRGVLYHCEPLHFLRGASMEMPIAHETRTVQVSSGRSYAVSRSSPGHSSILGPDHSFPHALSSIGDARRLREKRHRAEQFGQRWFSGQKPEAETVLRNLLRPARREVLIVDPYFGASELLGFALAVSMDNVPIMVLTSHEFLTTRVDEQDPNSPENGDVLLAEFTTISRTARMNPLHVRVMRGDRPDIHDRFFKVDDQVWLLGSSLNEFGSRGTMMVMLPDPEPIAARLVEVWDRMPELTTWTAERRQKRKNAQSY